MKIAALCMAGLSALACLLCASVQVGEAKAVAGMINDPAALAAQQSSETAAALLEKALHQLQQTTTEPLASSQSVADAYQEEENATMGLLPVLEKLVDQQGNALASGPQPFVDEQRPVAPVPTSQPGADW
eukprot:scpid106109/ scgid10709/ 